MDPIRIPESLRRERLLGWEPSHRSSTASRAWEGISRSGDERHPTRWEPQVKLCREDPHGHRLRRTSLWLGRFWPLPLSLSGSAATGNAGSPAATSVATRDDHIDAIVTTCVRSVSAI